MESAEYIILALNVTLGLGIGWILARRFAQLAGRRSPGLWGFTLIVGVYLIECVALAASMATSILSIALAFVWGTILARSTRQPIPEIRRDPKLVLLFGVYSSLPAASLISVPVVSAVSGWSVLAVGDGARFGVPSFLPWPVNTILGFFVTVACITVALKVLITIVLVRSLAESSRRG